MLGIAGPKIQNLSGLLLAILFCLLFQINGFAKNQGVNPSYDLINLRETTWEPYGIGGLDWLPDGRLVVAEWGGNSNPRDTPNTDGKLFLLSNVMNAASPADVTREEILTGLPEPLGLVVIEGEIFIHQKSTVATQIMRVWNANGTWNIEKFADGWGLADPAYWHSWPGGLLYKDGYFHFNFSSRLGNGNGAENERGAWIRVDRQSKQYQVMAGGMRTNTGIFWGPWDQIWGVDVQGDWRPDNTLIHLEEGKFYGHRGGATPADVLESPPAVYCPQNDQCNSPVGGMYLKTGPYAGQFIVGEHNHRTINRYFVERIESTGQMQGAVMDFSWGHQPDEFRNAFANKFVMGLDGESIIYGCAGDESGWVAGPALGALVRMVPNKTLGFDVLAIRSTGNNEFEIEFSNPASATGGVSTNYTLEKWTTDPSRGYGAGAKHLRGPVPVSSVSFVPGSNNKKIKVVTTGLTEQFTNAKGTFGWTVFFNLTGVQSATGNQPLYDPTIYYTLKNFGPGVTPVPGCTNQNSTNYNPRANDDDGTCLVPVSMRLEQKNRKLEMTGSALNVFPLSTENYSINIYDLKGELIFTKSRLEGKFEYSDFPKQGVYTVKLSTNSWSYADQILVYGF